MRHLVYLTAFMLDEGQSLADITGPTPPAWQILSPDGKTLTVSGPPHVFYNTCAPAVADAAAARLRPQTVASFVEPVRSVAWRDVPSTYVICDRDHAIPVPAQEAMSAHAGAAHRLERPLAVPHRPRRGRGADPRRGRIAVQNTEEIGGAPIMVW